MFDVLLSLLLTKKVDLKLQRVICGNTLVVNTRFWLTGNVIWLDVEQMKIHFFSDLQNSNVANIRNIMIIGNIQRLLFK